MPAPARAESQAAHERSQHDGRGGGRGAEDGDEPARPGDLVGEGRGAGQEDGEEEQQPRDRARIPRSAPGDRHVGLGRDGTKRGEVVA